jgi:hypothetical protein
MAKTTIKATTAVHTITIGGVTYNDTADTCNLRSTAPRETETTFADEAVGGSVSTGTETLQMDLAGILKYDGTGTKPFIPLSAYQDKTTTVQYFTGCSVAGTASAFDGGPTDVRAGQTRRWSSSFQFTGTWTVLWDETPPT